LVPDARLDEMLGYAYLKYLHETDTVPEDVKKLVNNLCIYLGISVVLEDALTDEESVALDWVYGCAQREIFNYAYKHHPEIFAEFYKKLPREIVQATIAEDRKETQ
jgi:hypothetical protein